MINKFEIEWQTMESAPRDGTPILLGGGIWGDDWRKDSVRVVVGWFEVTKSHSFWNTCAAENGHCMFLYENPTKWAKLPE